MTRAGKGEVGVHDVSGATVRETAAPSVDADVIGILDTIDVPIVVVGRDCRIVRCNRAATGVLGLATSDIGRRPSDVLPLKNAKDLEQNCGRVMADGASTQHEIHWGDRWFLLRIAPYTGADGQIQGAVLTFTNITGFRASVGQAIYEREYTKAILNTVIEPLVVLNENLQVQTANRAFYSLFGVSRERTQGIPLPDLGSAEWKACGLWSLLQSALSGESEFQTMDVECEFPEVGRRTLLVDARRLSRDGVNLLLLGFRDITERKNLERQREALLAQEGALRKDAEAAARAKDRFLAVLSHELRTPLSPIVMSVADMEKNPLLPVGLREDVSMIRRNVELEVRLIDDLLDLNRVTSGKMRFHPEPTHVHATLKHAVENCVSDTSAKKLKVELDLKAENELVRGDPARLQQVFWNLIRNAAKFTPEGGRISIRTESLNGMVRVEVRDTGIGIPTEFLPKVFDAFEQADAKTTREFGGLGLGLAICKAVVDMHGGTIEAQSKGGGQGATFVVGLPIASASEPEVSRPVRQVSRGGTNGHLRLLLVEDHPDTCNVLARLLSASRYAVKTAGSIESALQLAASEPFDIIVSDIGLPDGTGYELMRQIRDRYGIKGIALSGYGMEEDRVRSKESGFHDHVLKPVNVVELEAVIQRVANG